MSMQKFQLRTSNRVEFIDITNEVRKLVNESGVTDGVCVVFVPHTTAGITINENADPSVVRDILSTLSDLVPQDRPYTHYEGNSDSHIQASLMGFSVNVIVEGGQLQLGTWQGVYFCEFDGPRSRQVWIKMLE